MPEDKMETVMEYATGAERSGPMGGKASGPGWGMLLALDRASYALAIGFSVYALLRFLESRRGGLAGLLGGITLTGVLCVAGCFLLGCCGSPMLAVYLTLFGSSFLGFTKPLTFALTIASVVVGYIWMERKSVPATDCRKGEEECKPT